MIILPLLHSATLNENHSMNTLKQCITHLTEFR